jgi:NADH-quinone oxidoreductase subunit L
MIWFVFFAKENKPNLLVAEAPWVMRTPLIILAFASIWLLISWNPISASGWFTWQMGDLQHSNWATLLSTSVVLISLLIAWFLYVTKNKLVGSTILLNGLSFDKIYKIVFEQSTLGLATVAETTDRKWIDGALHLLAYAQVSFAHVLAWFDTYIIDGSVNATAWMAGAAGSLTRSFQSGKIQLYIFWAVLGLIIFLFFVLI